MPPFCVSVQKMIYKRVFLDTRYIWTYASVYKGKQEPRWEPPKSSLKHQVAFQRKRQIRRMIEMCHVDKGRRGGETFQTEITVQTLWKHQVWGHTFSNLVLLGRKVEARGKWLKLRLEFTLRPVAPPLSTRVMWLDLHVSKFMLVAVRTGRRWGRGWVDVRSIRKRLMQ